MLCFRLKLLCYSSLDFPPPPPPSTTSPPARIAVFCSGFLTTPPSHPNSLPRNNRLYGYSQWGGGGVGNLHEKDRNVVMLLFLFFSGLR